MANQTKKIPQKIKDVYPNYDLVCKINYHSDWQGSILCEDVEKDTLIYNAHIVSPDIQQILEENVKGFINYKEKILGRKLKVKKIISNCIEQEVPDK
jgi:hypothetical protein